MLGLRLGENVSFSSSFCLYFSRRDSNLTSFINFFLSVFLWFSFDPLTSEFQFVENHQWIKGYFNFKFGIDGISILFIRSILSAVAQLSLTNKLEPLLDL